MKSSTHGLVAAKDRIEEVQNKFFREVFTAEHDGVELAMNGRYELKSVKSENPLSSDEVVSLHRFIFDVVKTKEMTGYCKVRNEIRAKYRVDIALSIPEVAEAVRYMDRKQNAAAA